jgi:hypothetical protein
MRFIYVYLIAYFVLILGAGVALFQAGVFSRLGTLWVILGSVTAVGLGVLLALTAEKPPVSQN